MKKLIGVTVLIGLATVLLTGCGQVQGQKNQDTSQNPGEFNPNSEITVVSRESGSGTRGAFIELLKIEEKDANGNKVDHTTDEAVISNSTSVVMTTIGTNPNAIGYISLGSLNDTVKALKVDSIEITVENIKNGTYKVSRPFNIALKNNASEASHDFAGFILSEAGQKIVSENGYIDIGGTAGYESKKTSGKIVVAGSSSVTPVMEKLKEAYQAVNPNAEIEIQLSDSSTGMNSAINGTCDIGMASRELKDSEIEKGLSPIVIAMDGIAIIVNKANPLDDISADQIKSIFIGELVNWSEISQ